MSLTCLLRRINEARIPAWLSIDSGESILFLRILLHSSHDGRSPDPCTSFVGLSPQILPPIGTAFLRVGPITGAAYGDDRLQTSKLFGLKWCDVNPVGLEISVSILLTWEGLVSASRRLRISRSLSPIELPRICGLGGSRLDALSQTIGYFQSREPRVGMSEQTVVHSSHCIPVPDSVDDITLAAIADPGMAAWAAFEARAKLMPGETVLVNGATGSAGRMAVQIAKHFGAKKVVATGRNRESLHGLLSMGADQLNLPDCDGKAPEDELKKQFEQGADVVLDYLWGLSAEQILARGKCCREDDAHSLHSNWDNGRLRYLLLRLLRRAPRWCSNLS